MIQGAQCNHKAPWKRGARGSESENRKCDSRGRGRSYEATDQEIWAASRSWKRQKWISPLEPPEGMQDCCHLDLALKDLFWTFDLLH